MTLLPTSDLLAGYEPIAGHHDELFDGSEVRPQWRAVADSLLRLGRVTAFFSEYYSVGVASYTKVGERTVSVGAFGYVHVLDPEPPAGAR